MVSADPLSGKLQDQLLEFDKAGVSARKTNVVSAFSANLVRALRERPPVCSYF